MINEKINLKEHYNLNNDVYLTSYCPDNFEEFSSGRKRKCLIVLPGGGYNYVSDREAEPVCLRFLGYDIATFLLKYSVKENIKKQNPIEEVLASISYIRKNSDKYHIDPNSISLIGFSAGGHLATASAIYHNDKEMLNKLGLKESDTKVNGCLLCYPVIIQNSDYETFSNIAGNNPELLERYSLDKHITKDFPKTFIFHTANDSVVDINNSLVLAHELHKYKTPIEMHIYPMCEHGLSLADESVYKSDTDKEYLDMMKPNSKWVEFAVEFIKNYL